MRKLILLFIILGSFNYIYCQWARTYGGDKNDYINSILQTSDGGFLIGGSTYSFIKGDDSNSKIWLIKINEQGEVEWEKMYGRGSTQCVLELEAKSYLIAGTCGPLSRAIIINIDDEGRIIWQKKYARYEDSLYRSWSNSILQLKDKSYLFLYSDHAGRVAPYYPCYVAKLSSLGGIEWTRYLWSSSYGYINCCLTKDDGIIIAASSGDAFFPLLRIIRLTSQGKYVWHRALYGKMGDERYYLQFKSLVSLNDGNYLASGWVQKSTEDKDKRQFLIKFNSDGQFIWQKIINEISNAKIIATIDGGFILCGNYLPIIGSTAIIKFNKDGEIEWQKAYGVDLKYPIIIQTREGDLVVGGETSSYGAGGYDILILKLDSQGNLNKCSTIAKYDINIMFSDLDIIFEYPYVEDSYRTLISSYSDLTTTATQLTSYLICACQPLIQASPSILYFGSNMAGMNTAAQKFHIYNHGCGQLSWRLRSDVSWISFSPSSGFEEGIVEVSVNSKGLLPGKHEGKIYIESENAFNSGYSVKVLLNVYDEIMGEMKPPFGFFDTPTDGATVFGSVPVTGWALDDIEVTKVEIKRSPHPSDNPAVIGPDGLVYIGDAVFVEGARPDIEQLYPTYPLNYRAGWGYMMLTNFLPNQGNGTFTIHAIAYDKEGHRVSLGSKTIYCDNANATSPFGTIDTPGQGATISGSSYVNFGWALTPQPKMIPTDGSTILVWVDGVPLGHPVYNQYRSDIATLFPGYKNSNGAVGYYYLDTTKYANGVHTIAWSVRDDWGRESGIGSRYFTVMNVGTGGSSGNLSGQRQGTTSLWPTSSFSISDSSRFIFAYPGYYGYESYSEVMSLPVDFSPLFFRTGYSLDAEPEVAVPDSYGVVEIRIKEVERIEVYLGGEEGHRAIEAEKKIRKSKRKNISGIGIISCGTIVNLGYLNTLYSSGEKSALSSVKKPTYYGYMIVGDGLKPLPIGSTLDIERGVFYWQPGPGFLGSYDFVFIKEDNSGFSNQMRLRVIITPKF